MKQRYPVAKIDEVPEGGRKIVVARGLELGVFQVEGKFYVYRNVCPHAGAPVCQGRIGGTTLPSGVYQYEVGLPNRILRCPWHGWEFDLTTGKHLVDERVKLRSYAVEAGAPKKSEDLDTYQIETDADTVYVLI